MYEIRNAANETVYVGIAGGITHPRDAVERLRLGFSRTEEQTREDVAPMMESALPLIVAHNASSTGTDIVGYLSESFGFSTFVRDDGTVYHTYSTTARGVEFLMGYYLILDRAPKGRDEGDAWQVWIRRHDEYDSE